MSRKVSSLYIGTVIESSFILKQKLLVAIVIPVLKEAVKINHIFNKVVQMYLVEVIAPFSIILNVNQLNQKMKSCLALN